MQPFRDIPNTLALVGTFGGYHPPDMFSAARYAFYDRGLFFA